MDKVLPETDSNLFDRFGHAIAKFNDYLVVGAPESDLNGINSGAVYVLKRSGNNWNRVATLLPSDPEENLNFGKSVSIFERTIVVGAPGYFQQKGIVYIFYRAGMEWGDAVETQRIEPIESEENDHFGEAVVTFEDQVLVGASRATGLANKSGVVYAFRGGNEWETIDQTATLTASDPTNLNGLENDFGSSLAYDGQVLVVGAHLADPTAFDDGAVYIFEKPISGWVDSNETAKLFQSNGANNSEFGHSVALLNDLIVVGGKRMEDASGNHVGAVVFKKGPGGWGSITEIAKLTTTLPGDYPFFWGSQVAIGQNQIVVSAPGVEGAPYGEDKLLVYEQPDGNWIDQSQDAMLDVDEEVKGYELGRSLILEESIIYAGVPDDDQIGLSSGSVITYERSGTNWVGGTQTQKIGHVESSAALDDFGRYVDVYGNIAVVGTPGDDVAGSSGGAAYVLQRQGAKWGIVAKLTASDGKRADGFGNGVAIHKNEIIIGAPFTDLLDNNGGVISYNTGAAYVFTKPATGWQNATETRKITLSVPEAEQKFGVAVDVEDGVAVVGAYNNSNSESLGSVHVFSAEDSNWDDAGQIALLVTLSNERGDGFGNAVRINDDLIVVGAVRTRFPEPGKVYVFERNGSEWSDMNETAILTPSTGGSRTFFGFVVDAFQNTIITGDQTVDVSGVSKGAAYIYEKPLGGWVDATETALLLASDGVENDFFATDVAISEDYAVVTAGGKDELTGAAYFFQKPESGWTTGSEDFKLPVEQLSMGSTFGFSIAAHDNKIIVGANLDSNEAGFKAGAVFLFETEKVVSTNDPQLERLIGYYPNPVGNSLKVEISENLIARGKLMINIMDMSGKFIDQRVLFKSGIEKFDLSGMAPGIYMVQIESGNSKAVYKIIKGVSRQ